MQLGSLPAEPLVCLSSARPQHTRKHMYGTRWSLRSKRPRAAEADRQGHRPLTRLLDRVHGVLRPKGRARMAISEVSSSMDGRSSGVWCHARAMTLPKLASSGGSSHGARLHCMLE